MLLLAAVLWNHREVGWRIIWRGTLSVACHCVIVLEGPPCVLLQVYKVRSREDGKLYAVKRSRQRFRGEWDRYWCRVFYDLWSLTSDPCDFVGDKSWRRLRNTRHFPLTPIACSSTKHGRRGSTCISRLSCVWWGEGLYVSEGLYVRVRGCMWEWGVVCEMRGCMWEWGVVCGMRGRVRVGLTNQPLNLIL